MRLPIIAGNWKMNTDVVQAKELVLKMRDALQAISGVEKVVCPPFVSLTTVAALLAGTDIRLGAQNAHWEAAGAYTGEISPAMLQSLCDYVILGHSERRAWFGESDEVVRRKTLAALAHGLRPIVCVGEHLEQNEAGRTLEVVKSQVEAALNGLEPEQVAGLVLAYEPIWAIGTGRAASAAQANYVSRQIRATIATTWGAEVAARTRIQYGGSVNSRNISEFVAQPDIDGALVGGASLKAEEFVSIVSQTAQVKAQAWITGDERCPS